MPRKSFPMEGFNEFVQSLPLSSELDFPRALREVLLNEPYCVKTTWKNNLIILNANPKKTNFEEYPALKKCNGLVMDATTRRVVAYSYDILQEVSGTAGTIEGNFPDDYLVEELHDGCVIRLFYYEGEWRVSTLKCVDARDAYFSDRKSFYTMFEEAKTQMGLDENTLNQDYCYTFLMFHPANHMVVPHQLPQLLLVSTYDTTKNEYLMTEEIPSVPKSKVYSFLSYEQMWNSLAQQEFQLPVSPNSGRLGYILTRRDNPSLKIKVEAPAYTEARRVKGNHPNILYRLLEVMKRDNFYRNGYAQQEFLRYYPQYQRELNRLTTQFRNYLSSIFRLYNEVYRTGGNSHHYIPDQRDRHIVDELYLIYREEGKVDYARASKLFGTYSMERLSNILNIQYVVRKRQVPRQTQS